MLVMKELLNISIVLYKTKFHNTIIIFLKHVE
jgi:hypothetical protein